MKRPSINNPLRDVRGQSVVEFALVVPVLMLMLVITLDFGRLFLSYVTLNNVTRITEQLRRAGSGIVHGDAEYDDIQRGRLARVRWSELHPEGRRRRS